MALVTSMMLSDQKRIRYFLLLVALSIGFYGLKGGLFSLLTGGQHTVWGPGNSVLGANNSIGLALNSALPVFWYLAQEENGWLKRILQLMFFSSIPAIMFTYSRASAFTLPIVLLAIMFKSRHRALTLLAVLIAGMLALPFIPQQWWNRQQSVVNYEADASAMSRIEMWQFSWHLALDRPLTGGGFEFQTRDTFIKHAPDSYSLYSKLTLPHDWTPLNTHNIFFAMLASHGFPGLCAFLAMIGFAALSCRRLKRAVRDRSDLRWVARYSQMIQVSLLGYLINGFFVNMEYFDLLYDLIGVVASLKVICYGALSEPVADEISLTANLSTAPTN